MTRTAAQTKLLKKTLEHVIDLYHLNYESKDDGPVWNQTHWLVADEDAIISPDSYACQASGCFAGWSTLLYGAKPTGQEAHVWPPEMAVEDRRFTVGTIGKVSVVYTENAKNVESYATELLGLDEDDRDILFNGDNDLTDLKHMVANLLSNRDILADANDRSGGGALDETGQYSWYFDADEVLTAKRVRTEPKKAVVAKANA